MSLNTDEGIEITSVDEYMREISKLNQNKKDPNAQMFFRGQAVDYWDIRPSIFRDQMLSVEHNLMSEPLRQIPNEFNNLGDSFEIMEKYQHYGMCTRLLDITTNPLVALYFSCERYKKEEYKDRETKNIEKVAPRGIVYFKEDNMPLKYNDLEVRIISRLASYDMNSDRTLEEIVEKLYQDTVISMDLKKKWLEENGMFEFIHICQSVCTVLPIMNNDRLIRQSGAFLLPGKFIVTNRGDNLKNAIIAKAESNLRNEFEGMFFYIDDNNKEKIRTELENCNISEANLFPELEYQLKYIRKHNEQFRRAVSYFEKFEKIEKNSTYNVEIKDEYDIDKLRMVIGKYDLEDGVKREIENVFLNNQDVDWIKRDSVISRIKIQICKKLLDNGYVKADAEKLAKNIIAKVIREK
ncbi:MAG: FRG domain-containing protein [Lachnospira sp.]|uniref:FRG domain-containing protein n=1 Tax=Lachnospira intestinalis TaxID=3133158 RepID=A0ABV1H2M6_9FIRM